MVRLKPDATRGFDDRTRERGDSRPGAGAVPPQRAAARAGAPAGAPGARERGASPASRCARSVGRGDCQAVPAGVDGRPRSRAGGPRIEHPVTSRRPGSPVGHSSRGRHRGGRPRRGAAAPVLVAVPPGSGRAGDRDRSDQGTAAGAGDLSPLGSGHRNARRWRRRPLGRSPSTRVHGRGTGVWRHRVDRRAWRGHPSSASERDARGFTRTQRPGPPRPGVRARRRPELGTVLFRDRRHGVRRRADPRRCAPGGRPRASSRRPRSLRSLLRSRSPRSLCRKRSDLEDNTDGVPQARVVRVRGARPGRGPGGEPCRSGRARAAVHARDRRELRRRRTASPAVRRLRRRALRPRADRAGRRDGGQRNRPEAAEAQRAPRRARSAERARHGSTADVWSVGRPDRSAALLLRARGRAWPADRRRPLFVPHAARSARSDSGRRADRGPRRLRVRGVHAPEGREGAAGLPRRRVRHHARPRVPDVERGNRGGAGIRSHPRVVLHALSDLRVPRRGGSLGRRQGHAQRGVPVSRSARRSAGRWTRRGARSTRRTTSTCRGPATS